MDTSSILGPHLGTGHWEDKMNTGASSGNRELGGEDGHITDTRASSGTRELRGDIIGPRLGTENLEGTMNTSLILGTRLGTGNWEEKMNTSLTIGPRLGTGNWKGKMETSLHLTLTFIIINVMLRVFSRLCRVASVFHRFRMKHAPIFLLCPGWPTNRTTEGNDSVQRAH